MLRFRPPACAGTLLMHNQQTGKVRTGPPRETGSGKVESTRDGRKTCKRNKSEIVKRWNRAYFPTGIGGTINTAILSTTKVVRGIRKPKSDGG